jgi:hypothetical protein
VDSIRSSSWFGVARTLRASLSLHRRKLHRSDRRLLRDPSRAASRIQVRPLSTVSIAIDLTYSFGKPADSQSVWVEAPTSLPRARYPAPQLQPCHALAAYGRRCSVWWMQGSGRVVPERYSRSGQQPAGRSRGSDAGREGALPSLCLLQDSLPGMIDLPLGQRMAKRIREHVAAIRVGRPGQNSRLKLTPPVLLEHFHGGGRQAQGPEGAISLWLVNPAIRSPDLAHVEPSVHQVQVRPAQAQKSGRVAFRSRPPVSRGFRRVRLPPPPGLRQPPCWSGRSGRTSPAEGPLPSPLGWLIRSCRTASLSALARTR